MSDSDGEQAARSVALEQAYVHEVYEQCAENTAQTRHWPRIYQFLEELEPGALVCDIGCGNGKYLSVNHSIFKVGVDRCKRFTGIARQKENEVLICDNLALPFRDESFDAVLSVAVVHHFATTERRVHALKELTRVLRIGGRLVISVWAMEQRHRKFESQDVLIPWPKVYCVNTSTGSSNGLSVPNIGSKTHDQTNQKYISTSKGNSQYKCKNESYWIDPIFTPSPSTSSPSSPNETCYSFFRRALQKLAGGRRGSTVRPWFLDSWQNGSGKSHGHYDVIDDTADVDELPIELRRLEDTSNVLNSKQADTFSMKSKSLGDILEIQRPDFVRSRSSIPGLSSTLTSDLSLDETSKAPSSLADLRPPLVTQDSQFDDDVVRDNVKNTAIPEIVNDLPDVQIESSWCTRRGNVQKQNSMNEELMSTDRLREKERVRRNIMKQASLNEDIICKRRTFENFKDSIYSGYATKKLQLLKNDLTTRLKQSTTNIERVSGMSIKNGFVRILQGWKSSDSEPVNTNDSNDKAAKDKQPASLPKQESNQIERRLSKEDGSDSSKDSSLQSDTSVDSEDSFASVIYVPKQEPPLVNGVQSFGISTSTSPGCQLNTTSAPPSPRVKHSPDLPSLRLKLISITPLLKQYPATSKSLPPPSPPGISLRSSFNSVPTRPFFSKALTPIESEPPKEKSKDSLSADSVAESEPEKVDKVQPSCPTIPEPVNTDSFPNSGEDDVPLICPPTIEEKLEQDRAELVSEEESRMSRLNQIKELLNQRPGFATRIKPSFPLVRRASTATNGQIEAVTRVLPRLLSLELFNPETDDLDSDSSGVSSPESVGSVISVISDERYIIKEEASKSAKEPNDPQSPQKTSLSRSDSIPEEDTLELASDKDNAHSEIKADTIHARTHSKLPSAQNSLEDKDEGRKQEKDDVTRISETQKSTNSSSNDFFMETTWSDECHQRLLEFTGELEKNLINDIDEYCKQDFCFDEDLTAKDRNRTKMSNDTSISRDKVRISVNESSECLLDSESVTEDDVLDFVLVSKADKYSDNGGETKSLSQRGNSIESSDIGDSIENTYSNSSDVDPGKSCNCSTVSILPIKADSGCNANNNNNNKKESTGGKPVYSRIAEQRRRFSMQRRSASEEIPSRESKGSAECLIAASNDTLVSAASSSSQESLPSDLGGGAITYHQYYHVFREGELDQLIKKYVENLHIISSYYDHASWCIVAEKVQVWTI